jgi:transcriptional regulator of nitric oxide reductase
MRSARASAWCSRNLAPLAFGAAALLVAAPAVAKVYYSQREALELAFPGADRIERRNFVLTREQSARIETASRAPLDSRIVTLHVGWRGEEVLGYALIDIHTVRTLPEALMTVLRPDGSVRFVRVLAFHEPEDYLPPARWFEQFDDRRLDSDLQLKRGVDAISGATLSARATTRSVRRALALWEVLVTRDREPGTVAE